MRLDRKKRKIIFKDEEYPYTIRNAQIYHKWLVADEKTKLELEKGLLKIVLDFS